jgi:[glutamine synthetase] adenylyltransferase / [glutamine synthetase]-adenylyl-L-tyrosine phosphorylase
MPELRAELQSRVNAQPDLEEHLTELRRFRNEEVLRIGLHDVAGALDVSQVSRQLSDLAEACVEACFATAEQEIEKRDGKTGASMVVVALGKLGGRELGYHADLDLLFLYSAAGETEKHISHHEHFARVGTKLISHLTLPLREGSCTRSTPGCGRAAAPGLSAFLSTRSRPTTPAKPGFGSARRSCGRGRSRATSSSSAALKSTS